MITSTANAKVKELIKLQKSAKLRREKKLYTAEGLRMFEEVPVSDLISVWVSESFAGKHRKLLQEKQIRPEILSDTVFAYVSDTKTPQGVLCVLRQKNYTLAEMLKDRAPLLLVLDGLQDPGNLGTIFRTAEAAGVTGIVLSDDCVDLYNPKVIRSTMGSVYRVPFVYTDNLPSALKKMQEKQITLYAAHLDGKNTYDKEVYLEGTAFLIGNEGNGLKQETAQASDRLIRIPMEGQVESLNAAVAASLLMFEAGRQRRNRR